MSRNVIKVCLFAICLFCINNCGFKPIYKLSEGSAGLKNYSVSINRENNISREIKEEIKKSFPSNSAAEEDYIIEIFVIQNLDPLITNTDGTIAKYRVEVLINFKVKDKKNSKYLIEDMARGFAQYTVETSEVESNDKKKRMIRNATNAAIQMMISKIQNTISITNDN